MGSRTSTTYSPKRAVPGQVKKTWSKGLTQKGQGRKPGLRKRSRSYRDPIVILSYCDLIVISTALSFLTAKEARNFNLSSKVEESGIRFVSALKTTPQVSLRGICCP